MPEREWIGAEDACERLGVRPQTLYAYVSRNPVRVRQDPDNNVKPCRGFDANGHEAARCNPDDESPCW